MIKEIIGIKDRIGNVLYGELHSSFIRTKKIDKRMLELHTEDDIKYIVADIYNKYGKVIDIERNQTRTGKNNKGHFFNTNKGTIEDAKLIIERIEDRTNQIMNNNNDDMNSQTIEYAFDD